jgi:hypothetical protein
VLYLVGNCVNLSQFGEGFLLVICTPARMARWARRKVYILLLDCTLWHFGCGRYYLCDIHSLHSVAPAEFLPSLIFCATFFFPSRDCSYVYACSVVGICDSAATLSYERNFIKFSSTNSRLKLPEQEWRFWPTAALPTTRNSPSRMTWPALAKPSLAHC